MIARLAVRVALFLARADRAWGYYTKLGYTWRLSWIKAGWR